MKDVNWSTAHPGFFVGLISLQDQVVEVTIVLQSGTEFADTYATWVWWDALQSQV